jgi:hypothetical protein
MNDFDNEFFKYLNDDSVGALLIDDVWGCGKTYNTKKIVETTSFESNFSKTKYYCYLNIDSITPSLNLKNHVIKNMKRIATKNYVNILLETKKIKLDLTDDEKAIINLSTGIIKDSVTWLTEHLKLKKPLKIITNNTDELFDFLYKKINLTEECVLIIDEIERKNASLSLRDLFLKIIEIQSNNNLKIILIMNSEELVEEDKVLLKLWTEKIIYKTLSINNNSNIIQTIKNMDKILKVIENQKNSLLFNQIYIKNIRILKITNNILNEITEFLFNFAKDLKIEDSKKFVDTFLASPLKYEDYVNKSYISKITDFEDFQYKELKLSFDFDLDNKIEINQLSKYALIILKFLHKKNIINCDLDKKNIQHYIDSRLHAAIEKYIKSDKNELISLIQSDLNYFYHLSRYNTGENETLENVVENNLETSMNFHVYANKKIKTNENGETIYKIENKSLKNIYTCKFKISDPFQILNILCLIIDHRYLIESFDFEDKKNSYFKLISYHLIKENHFDIINLMEIFVISMKYKLIDTIKYFKDKKYDIYEEIMETTNYYKLHVSIFFKILRNMRNDIFVKRIRKELSMAYKNFLLNINNNFWRPFSIKDNPIIVKHNLKKNNNNFILINEIIESCSLNNIELYKGLLMIFSIDSNTENKFIKYINTNEITDPSLIIAIDKINYLKDNKIMPFLFTENVMDGESLSEKYYIKSKRNDK